MNEDNQQKERIAAFLKGILTGWGLPETWAKVITGALIGGLTVLWALTQAY